MNPDPFGRGKMRHQLNHIARGGLFPLLEHELGNLSGMLRFHMGSEKVLSHISLAEFTDDGGMAGHLSILGKHFIL